MAIMITGGTGFLGSYLTRHLVHEKGITGKNLILFDRYPNKDRIADVLEEVILITGDITEPTELAAAMKTYEVDQVYHLCRDSRRPDIDAGGLVHEGDVRRNS
jgi:nucleoside-diphosphate-sugar epimerase